LSFSTTGEHTNSNDVRIPPSHANNNNNNNVNDIDTTLGLHPWDMSMLFVLAPAMGRWPHQGGIDGEALAGGRHHILRDAARCVRRRSCAVCHVGSFLGIDTRSLGNAKTIKKKTIACVFFSFFEKKKRKCVANEAIASQNSSEPKSRRHFKREIGSLDIQSQYFFFSRQPAATDIFIFGRDQRLVF
jgi:hypothetical protein